MINGMKHFLMCPTPLSCGNKKRPVPDFSSTGLDRFLI
jgi:hypothetical protein